MSSLATKMATKMAEKELKKGLKDMAPKPPAGSGPRLRTGNGVGDKMEGCCNKCCATVCRTSPWTQVICWAMIALIITTLIVWLGGAFLVGPAKNNTSQNVCGINLTIPLLNKDAYVFYLGSSGIIVIIMIFSSCICCCSFGALFNGGCPKVVRICGCVGFVISLLAVSVYVAWVGLGTYFVIKIHGADTVCRNTIIYLVLLYVYLFILVIVGIVVLVWKCSGLVKSAEGRKGSKVSARESLSIENNH